ncbi:MAG TPA: hypothetical protein VGM39_00435 [Kofleriaceae bacterium]|jgi:hypothetical protein
MRTIPVLLVLVAACGTSDDGSGEVALGGTIAGSVNGDHFEAKYGFAGTHGDDNTPLIAFGEANLDCTTDPSHSEIHGIGAFITGFEYESIGTPQDDAFVEVFRYKGTHYQLAGSSSNTFTLTAVDETSVAGTIDFGYTTDDGDDFALTGDFVVTRCP